MAGEDGRAGRGSGEGRLQLRLVYHPYLVYK